MPPNKIAPLLGLGFELGLVLGLEAIFLGSNFPRTVITEKNSLREKYPNTKFFLVRIFLYSVQIQENMEPKKLCI